MGKLRSKDTAAKRPVASAAGAAKSSIPEVESWKRDLAVAQAEAERNKLQTALATAKTAEDRRRVKLEFTMTAGEQRKAAKSKAVNSLVDKAAFSDLFAELDAIAVPQRAVPTDPLALPAAPVRQAAKKSKAPLDKAGIAHFTAIVAAPGFQANPLAALRKALEANNNAAVNSGKAAGTSVAPKSSAAKQPQGHSHGKKSTKPSQSSRR